MLDEVGAELLASRDPPERARSWMVLSGRRPSASPMSPNWRSRSTSAALLAGQGERDGEVRRHQRLSGAPFGPRTQIIGASAMPLATAAPRRRATAFSSAKAIRSVGSGSVRMSSAPDSKTRRTKPFGEPVVMTTTGRSGWCFHRAVDEVQRSVGVALTRHDEEIRSCFLQRAPALVETIDDPHDLEPLLSGSIDWITGCLRLRRARRARECEPPSSVHRLQAE